jgi:dTDP-glucose 4,6-dehydratase
MGTLIVTGAAGFIGSNFVRLALAHTDDRVVVADSLTYAGNVLSLAELESHPRFAFVRVDIADRDGVRALFRDHPPTALVNFAAESHVDRSIDDPSAFLRTNVGGTYELLEATRRHLQGVAPEIRAAFRFLQVSTDEVYGSLGEQGAFSETTAYAPNSPYAASKAAADHFARAWHETYRLPVLLTNCSNNYGPFQFPEKLIPLMILNACEAKALPIYGDGGNVRDWLHVEDHCRALLLVLRHGLPGEKYNVGGNSERTNLQVVDGLCAALEKWKPAASNERLRSRGFASYAALKSFVPDRPGHDRRYAIDASKIQAELGWQPEFDFERGLEATVRWYLENGAWCESVRSGRYRGERLGLGREGA